MGKTGGTSGKGGRNHRLNWTKITDGWRFGDYTIELYAERTAHPWRVLFRHVAMQQNHGLYTGYQRFKTDENAKRWVEKRLARRRT